MDSNRRPWPAEGGSSERQGRVPWTARSPSPGQERPSAPWAGHAAHRPRRESPQPPPGWRAPLLPRRWPTRATTGTAAATGAPLAPRRAHASCRSTAIFPPTPQRLLGNVLEHQQAGAELATPVAPGRTEDTMSTVSGLDPNVAARLVDEGYGPGAWHGPNLKAALTDIAPRAAFWRPGRSEERRVGREGRSRW